MHLHVILFAYSKPSLWEMKQHRGGWEDIRSGSLITALEIGRSQQLSMIEQDKLKVCMYAYMNVCMYVCIYVCMYAICMHASIYVYLCMHAWNHVCTYVYMYVCMYNIIIITSFRLIWSR